jgi:superfamily II DNA or RNA helicase
MIELTGDQVDGINFLYVRKDSGLVMSPGMGKTLIIAVLAKVLLNGEKLKKVIVFTHAKGVKSYKKAPVDLKIFYLTKVEHIDRLGSELEMVDMVVVSTSILTKIQTKLLPFIRQFDMMVVDEIHKYKNFKTAKVAMSLKQVRSKLRGRFYGITATPFYNKLEDVFWVMTLIDDSVFTSYDRFWDDYIEWKPKMIWCKKRIYTAQGVRYIREQRQIRDITGYKNLDLFMDKLNSHLFIRFQSQFEYNFKTVKYSVVDRDAYIDKVEGKGLDKIYSVSLVNNATGKTISLKRSRLESLPSVDGSGLISMDMLHKGSVVKYDRRICRVSSIEENTSAADFVRRLVPLQLHLSKTNEKYNRLLDIIPREKGCIIYCNYRSDGEDKKGGTVFWLERRLAKDFPDRRVVVLTGGDTKIESKIDMLGKTDLVLMTRVASESLDFYYDTMIMYEMLTNPGSFIQLIGRATRMNADYTKVNVSMLIGEGTIEQYFYERLVYLLSSSMYTGLKEAVKSSFDERELEFISRVNDSPLGRLKELLLWKRVGRDLF